MKEFGSRTKIPLSRKLLVAVITILLILQVLLITSLIIEVYKQGGIKQTIISVGKEVKDIYKQI